MKRYFTFQNLPAEQLARWGAAVAEYDQVVRSNIERERGAPMTDLQWAQLKAAHRDTGRIHGHSYRPGDETSALFARLIAGLPALDHPPPESFGLPWYAPVDEPEPLHVTVQQSESMFVDEPAVITIDGFSWNALGFDASQQTVIVSHGPWINDGMRWVLQRVQVPTTASRNPLWFSGGHEIKGAAHRIATLADVDAEARWYADLWKSLHREVAGSYPQNPADRPAWLAHLREQAGQIDPSIERSVMLSAIDRISSARALELDPQEWQSIYEQCLSFYRSTPGLVIAADGALSVTECWLTPMSTYRKAKRANHAPRPSKPTRRQQRCA